MDSGLQLIPVQLGILPQPSPLPSPQVWEVLLPRLRPLSVQPDLRSDRPEITEFIINAALAPTTVGAATGQKSFVGQQDNP